MVGNVEYLLPWLEEVSTWSRVGGLASSLHHGHNHNTDANMNVTTVICLYGFLVHMYSWLSPCKPTPVLIGELVIFT